jgi:putative flippase GtrA
LVDGHWLGRFRTPLLLKLWRYGAGSIVAAATSFVAYPLCFSLFRFGAITSTWIAFLAGAVPNWVLNRRWAWQKQGREGMGRETTLYVIVSVVSLAVSSVVTKLTAMAVANDSHAAKGVIVTFSYIASVLVLSGLKYLVYDRFVFIDRRSRAKAPETVES